jgi:CheY-like chemotaxis protein
MAALDLKTLLGTAIKSERSQLGISQEELAYRAGLHRTYISDLERGARNPSIESVEKLARALQISVAGLFQKTIGGNGVKQPVEILLVEDNPRDVKFTIRAFEKAHISNPVHVVSDGVEALDFVFATGPYSNRSNARRPDIILLDLNLPKKSGFEVLREIKDDRRTQHIPVIVLTASNRSADITECRRLGADNYILKPVDFRSFSEITPQLSLAWVLVKPNGTLSAQPSESILNRRRFRDAVNSGHPGYGPVRCVP